ncbi:PD-(D/E)XK nuclease family protein [Acinetobacter sp. VNK23]|uniref:PDDEXK-like family protein n=1 Tax=Acinetobacter thutiue TaxID=2998078 RepID=UPI002577D0CF|nr:PD-(D/E)XK nuclease family protein [Acinetobacter thutiue]MDM1020914.1 PD-(D/E)XK nuclease family protein [Acinetobacter thutiue]
MELAITEFSNQLANFFNDWKRIEQQQQDVVQKQLSFEENLGQFFKDWRRVFINDKKLARFFNHYQSDEVQAPILEAKRQGLAVNVWQTAGLKNEEVRHSKVLKWFLDCRGDHGQGNAILLQLLKELPVLEKYQPQRYFATEECCPLGNQESRVDIEIDADEFLLFIEIKINATEGKDQLQRYIDIAQAKAKNRDWLIVYLTRDGKLPERYQSYEKDNKVIALSWKKLSKVLYEYTKGKEVNNRSIWLVKQFADHIKTF